MCITVSRFHAAGPVPAARPRRAAVLILGLALTLPAAAAGEPDGPRDVRPREGLAPQAVITVDTLADAVAADGACSLREAILNANGDDQSGSGDCAAGAGAPDEIVFASSLAGGTITLNGTELPKITDALRVTGPVPGDPAGLTLDGDDASRIFFVDTPAGELTELRHLTVTGGRLAAGGGAGIFSGSDLSLTAVAILGNATEGDGGVGGGLAVIAGDLTLTDCIVADNTTAGTGSGGGGVYLRDGELILLRTALLDNTTQNTGSHGGGLLNLGTGSSTLTDCTVAGNTTMAAGARGGGVYINVNGPAVAEVERCTVSGNNSGGSGGGLDLTSGGSGIDFILTNSTISGNTAGGNGGGVFTTGSIHLRHSTVAFNTAEVAGDGIYRVTIPFFLDNVLVVQAGEGESACNGVAFATGSFATDASCNATVASLAALGLQPLADNGGLTWTHALTPGSVAIDRADDDLCAELDPMEDQRGVDRPQDGVGDGSGGDLDGGCDAGAWEMPLPEGPVLRFLPPSLDFGDVTVGATVEGTASLENAGSATAGGIAFSGLPDAGFTVDTVGCGASLPAGASCTVEIVFTPGQAGAAAATLVVNGSQGSGASLGLAGTGIFAGGVSPQALEADPVGGGPGANGVFEPGETVDVAPAWRNDNATPVAAMTGTATSFAGPAGAVYTVSGDAASYGTLAPGESASCLDTGVCYGLGVDDPAVRPAAHWDASFEETLDDPAGTARTWTLHVGDSFTDMPRGNPFYPLVETLLHRGVTGGCGGTQYCPGSPNNRGQMAVFLLRAQEGETYVPPACVAGSEVFDDVPATSPFCAWIEELAGRGVTAGCGGNDYCPGGPVNRGPMAVFLLRTLLGPGYTPPPCTGVFGDVPCPSTFAAWVENLAARGITSGCGGGNYCPGTAVNRAQMAAFLGQTFELELYGP